MSNLYQDAILDAKALRASAMANAKAALEEAFEPKIQEMISKKLAEEVDELEEIEEALDEKEEDVVKEAEHADDHKMEESEGINEAELEEILSQLEELERVNETEATLNEKAEEENEGIVKEEEEEEEETEEVESEEEETKEAPEGDDKPAPSDDTEVIELSVGQLKDILMSVEAAKQSMLGAESPATEEPTADTKADADIAGIDLDEILDELAAEGIEEDITADVHKPSGDAAHPLPGSMEEEEGIEEVKKELEEAKATIATLRQDLQEVNLLNAKYLYMNKLFKSKSLTESEKVKVINALDRATNVKEVKLTYETLSESFEKKKQTIKESIGFASKPAGVAPKANIVEADQFISRWQKLAGIK